MWIGVYQICEADMDRRVVMEQDIKTGDWGICCPELPGCTFVGRTSQEAEWNIQEAIRPYLDPMPNRPYGTFTTFPLAADS